MPEIIKSIPKASRTFNALNGLGYTLPSAVADIIDNSISRGKAKNIHIDFGQYEDENFYLTISDDGVGMTEIKLKESMNLGSSNDDYDDGDLSKYGIGLKTASLSQSKVLYVISKSNDEPAPSVFCWDMNHVDKTNEWELLKLNPKEINQLIANLSNSKGDIRGEFYKELFAKKSFTVVFWNNLYRFSSEYNSFKTESGKENFSIRTINKLGLYIRLIFGRFMSGENNAPKTNFYLNNELLLPFDPFCRNEEHTTKLEFSKNTTNFQFDGIKSTVNINCYILPSNPQGAGTFKFSSFEAFSDSGGILSLNDAQGYYFYRNNRLIDFGGWFGTKFKDEHHKLARVSIDFTEDNDQNFPLTPDKTKIKSIPEIFKKHLIEKINKTLIREANTRYRNSEKKNEVIVNEVRRQVGKVSELSNELITKDEIYVSETLNKEKLVIQNQNGSIFSDDLTFKNIENNRKISSMPFDDDSIFWKMVPNPHNEFQVIINSNHPFYEKIYGNHEKDKKLTAIMDAFLFTMAYVELKCISENNELLFDQMKKVSSEVLRKMVEKNIV
ncbi:MAG: hypothetical protein RL259_417 [Bacteroidota bacterium]|jgi:hypothetical protein